MAACKKWDLEPNNTIVILNGGSCEDDLMLQMDLLTWWVGNPEYHIHPRLEENDYVVFTEPDLNNEVTGFAIRPGYTHSHIDSLPLLREGVKTNG